MTLTASTSGLADLRSGQPLPAADLVVRLATEAREALELATRRTSRQPSVAPDPTEVGELTDTRRSR